MSDSELNIGEVIAVLGKVEAAARGAAGDALELAAEYLLAETDPHVPFQKGTLEASGVASVDRSELVSAVSYDTPYAVDQHENVGWKHTKPGAEAKFLENRMNDPTVQSGIQKIIQGAVGRAI